MDRFSLGYVRWMVVFIVGGLGFANNIGAFDGNPVVDLAVGVVLEDINGIADAGAIHVLDGSTSGLISGRQIFMTQDTDGLEDQCEDSDEFGRNMISGDFNGDGYADLAVYVSELIGDVKRAGAVQVIYGSYASLSEAFQTDQFIHQGLETIPGEPASYSYFGSALAAGDFNRDGYADLVIGQSAWNFDDVIDSGAIYVIPGGPVGLDCGRTVVFSQGVGGLPGTPMENDYFGRSLEAADFNGDDYCDLAIGVPGKTIQGNESAGCVVLMKGTHFGLVAADFPVIWQGMGGVIAEQPEADDSFGTDLSSGDFDGDGYADLAIGVWESYSLESTYIPFAGGVHIVHGSADGLKSAGNRFFRQGENGVSGAPEEEDGFGVSLASGDFNGDGFCDLIAGVPYEDVNEDDEGAFHLMYGSHSGIEPAGSALHYQGDGLIPGIGERGDNLGLINAAADFDHDGFSDLALGLYEKNLETEEVVSNAGILIVIPGSSAGLTTEGILIFSQDDADIPDEAEDTDLFGYSLAPSAMRTMSPECSETGVSLFMTDTGFLPGELCACDALVCNAGTEELEGYPLFVILEVAGTYFFGPSFTEYDSYLADYPVFEPGSTRVEVLPEFEWPSGAGSFDGCILYGALTDPAVTTLVGEMGSWTFGWSEP